MPLAQYCECLCTSLKPHTKQCHAVISIVSTTPVGGVLKALWGSCRCLWLYALLRATVDALCHLTRLLLCSCNYSWEPWKCDRKYGDYPKCWLCVRSESCSTLVLTCIVWCPSRSRLLQQLIPNVGWTLGHAFHNGTLRDQKNCFAQRVTKNANSNPSITFCRVLKLALCTVFSEDVI